jgi:hypothetical protein
MDPQINKNDIPGAFFQFPKVFIEVAGDGHMVNGWIHRV